MSSKRYFWLKLPETFFRQKEIRGLRRQPDGAELVIIYQEIMLESINREGRIVFEQYAPTFAEEIADAIGEDPEKVQTVLEFLEEHQLIERITENEIELPGVVSLIGSETESAARMRRTRAKESPEDPEESNTESTKKNNERTTSAQCANNVPQSDREIDIEKEIEIDTDTDTEKDSLLSPAETVSASKTKAAPVPYQEIMAAYNETLGEFLPNIQKIDGNRRKTTAARYKEAGSVEALREVFELVKESDFLTGRNGAWQASFDWIMKPSNFQKIREKTYKNREGTKKPGKADAIEVFEKIYRRESEKEQATEADFVTI